MIRPVEAPRRQPFLLLRTLAVLLSWAAGGPFLLAQGNPNAGAAPAVAAQPNSGPQIRSVSVYGDYYSNFVPNGAGLQPGSQNLPSDIGAGGSIVFGWTKYSERNSFSLTYSPSYIGYFRNSSLNSLNHALSLNVSRKLAPRWTLTFGATGNLSSIEQSVFAPTALSGVAAVPATFQDFASGLLAGKFANNPQLATALTNAPIVESPLSSLLYGQRMFTSSAQASLSYSYSPRFSVTMSAGGGRTQEISTDQTLFVNTFQVPNTTTGTAGIAFTYSVSPFTQFGASATTNRVVSPLYDAYTTTSLATLGHTMAQRWLIQIHGGVAVANAVREVNAIVPAKPGPAAGGSLGYKTDSHAILTSFDRTVNDTYGTGATTNYAANAAWHYRRPGSSWWFDASFGWQQLEGGVLGNTSGWRASAGLNHAIGAHVVVLAQYAHLAYSGGLIGNYTSISQDAVRFSLTWMPHAVALQ